MFSPNCRILIADDSSFSRVMTRNALRELGYSQVTEAESGLKAQEALLQIGFGPNTYDLLISDIHMPGMTGLGLLRWVREQSPMPGLPVMLLTSSQDLDEIHEAGRVGVSHYLLKPIDVSMLRERLAHAWRKHGQAFQALKAKSK